MNCHIVTHLEVDDGQTEVGQYLHKLGIKLHIVTIPHSTEMLGCGLQIVQYIVDFVLGLPVMTCFPLPLT